MTLIANQPRIGCTLAVIIIHMRFVLNCVNLIYDDVGINICTAVLYTYG